MEKNMKYLDEFRNPEISQKILKLIRASNPKDRDIVLMEVCGTHTMSIFRSGIRSLLPENIRLLSGPGCPVCVTPNSYIDKAIHYSRTEDLILATFGDMVRVPGTSSSLEQARAEGGDIRIVYSSLDAYRIAKDNPSKRIIFLGIGFETTSPSIAATIKRAKEENSNNFFVLSGHKLIPQALEALLKSGDIKIDGFILPGHVSAIIGLEPYEFISRDYGIPCVVTGFEPVDILQGIQMLMKQIHENVSKVEIQYTRVVREQGNPIALKMLREVFEAEDSEWRGLGKIHLSGYSIKESYSSFDAENEFHVPTIQSMDFPGCICGAVLKGIKTPEDCGLFGRQCTPEDPKGPCMVSSEGTCSAYYKYRGLNV